MALVTLHKTNAVPMVRLPSPQDQPIFDVALLFTGGLRDFDAGLAHKLSRNVLMPLSRSTTTLDMFACNEPGDRFRPDSRRVIQESGAKLFELQAWSFAWLNQTHYGAPQAQIEKDLAKLGPAFLWALRVEKCYQASKSRGNVSAARGVEHRYDFFVRLRPDLVHTCSPGTHTWPWYTHQVWDEALGAVNTWSTGSISMRMRAYSVSAHLSNPGSTTNLPIHCALTPTITLIRGRGHGASRPPWLRIPRPSVAPPFTLMRPARRTEPNASS